MKNNPLDSLSACTRLAGSRDANSGSKTASPAGHFQALSTAPPDSALASDIQERTFRELIRWYRHSSVGRRALGIAHQISTPLQILSFQLDLLEQKARKEWELLNDSSRIDAEKLVNLFRYRQEKFCQLRNELEKLQNLTRRLILQGRHEDAREKSLLDLNEIFRQELELYLANPDFKHQVSKEFHFVKGLPLIVGHYIDFSQSFRNLIDNALEAMEGLEHRHLTVITAYRDKYFVGCIGDTGVGIPPENLSRIFEPFFTTKRSREGIRAGLGLFMVHRLLAPYQAKIMVDSAPGETWVTVSIPVV
jgi:signal transduction histidine kinase